MAKVYEGFANRLSTLSEMVEITESGAYDKAYNLGKAAALAGKKCEMPWEPGYPNDLMTKAFKTGYKEWKPKTAKAVKTVKEGKEYGDSSDFESDISDLEQLVKKFDAIINKPEFASWVEATDDNFGKKGGMSATKMYEKLGGATENLKGALDSFYQYMIDISE